MSASKISRMETGKSGLHADDVAALLGFYQVPAAKRQELLDLLRPKEQKGWWERQAGLPQLWRALIDFESKATRIQHFQPLIIPGPLQTDEYCRALIAGMDDTISQEELDNLVASRMARQTLLTRSNAPQYLAVITEDILWQNVGGPGVMARQIRHLLGIAERPNITLRLVPRGQGAYVGLRGAFLLLEFQDEPGLVHIENHSTGMFLEEEADLSAYRLALGHILNKAISGTAMTERLNSIIEQLTKRDNE